MCNAAVLTILTAVLTVFLYIGSHGAPMPQDMSDVKMGALMAVGQAKDMLDSGGAARMNRDFELMGAKVSGGVEVGFGDAIKRQRRDAHSDGETNKYVIMAVEEGAEEMENDGENENESESTSSSSSSSSASSSSSSSGD